MTVFDFAIAGAGIAGASLAAELAQGGATVLLLEAEDQPGYHSTGRSAAFWDECYGGPDVVPLTLASGPYLREHGFLRQRGALYIGREDEGAQIDSFLARYCDTGASIERVGASQIRKAVPGVREDWSLGVWEPACADIDVAGLHAHYLARARAGGVELKCRARLVGAVRAADTWTLTLQDGRSFKAAKLVNAAGAWADDVAKLAGARPLGLKAYSRTVVQARTDPAPPADMPLVLDISGRFYFKPEAGRLWLSPHDEVPSLPQDVAPEEMSVAEAIDRFEQVVDWRIERVERRWAGLRTFAPDRLPVYGPDPRLDAFVWFAGQGGFGIQTAPAAARLLSQRLLAKQPDAMTRSLDQTRYDPARLG